MSVCTVLEVLYRLASPLASLTLPMGFRAGRLEKRASGGGLTRHGGWHADVAFPDEEACRAYLIARRFNEDIFGTAIKGA